MKFLYENSLKYIYYYYKLRLFNFLIFECILLNRKNNI